MKTVEQLTAEKQILEQALAEAGTLVADRASRSYQVQSATSQAVLQGSAEARARLEKAQRDLQESVDALVRQDHLRTAIKSLEEQIVVARGAERRQSCEAIANEHAALYGEYIAASKSLLAQFRQLQTLNFSHMGMTGRELHGAHERELNLPAVTGPLCARSNFSTGQEG